MKRIIQGMTISFIIALSLVFTGCASSMVTVLPKDISKTISDKEQAYITFSRPAYVGAALTNTVVEFDPVTKKTKLVGILGSQNKVLYSTQEGTHYFYMEGGENDDMIKVTVDKNKMYYVETEVGFGVVAGRFYFKPFKYSIEKDLENLKDSKCDKDFLKKYEFTKIYEEDKTFASFGDKYESDSLKVEIECSKGVVKKYTRGTGSTIDDLKEAELVTVNKEGLKYYENNLSNYLSEIDEDFEEWVKEDSLENELKREDGFPLNK